MSRRKIESALPPMHPGELLREDVLPALGRTRAEIARLLGVSRQTLHAILTERAPVTPEMALRLGKLCGKLNGIAVSAQGFPPRLSAGAVSAAAE